MVRLVFRPYTQIQTNDLHVSIATSLHQSFPWLHPSSGIVHHLSGPNGYALPRINTQARDGAIVPPARGRGSYLNATRTPLCVSLRIRVLAPKYSHTRQTPWSVFQDGSLKTILSGSRGSHIWNAPTRVQNPPDRRALLSKPVALHLQGAKPETGARCLFHRPAHGVHLEEYNWRQPQRGSVPQYLSP